MHCNRLISDQAKNVLYSEISYRFKSQNESYAQELFNVINSWNDTICIENTILVSTEDKMKHWIIIKDISFKSMVLIIQVHFLELLTLDR